jgi:hypothetical protein
VIVMPFPPSALSGHDERHSFAHTKLVKQWRGWAKIAALDAPKPVFGEGKPYTAEGDIHITVRFYPPNKRSDRLNFPNRCKPLFDGLAEAWGVNDARFVPHYEFHAPEAPGRVEFDLGETHD